MSRTQLWLALISVCVALQLTAATSPFMVWHSLPRSLGIARSGGRPCCSRMPPSEFVSPRHPIVPVFHRLLRLLIGADGAQLRERHCQLIAVPVDRHMHLLAPVAFAGHAGHF